MSHTLINGQFADTIPFDDRGLAYGDGLFETFALQGGNILFRERHLARLQRGARRLMIDLDMAATNAELDLLSAQWGSDRAVLKLIVTRGSSGRGYGIDPLAPARRIVTVATVADYPASYYRSGIELALCQTPLAIAPLLAGIKHLNRLEQVLARAELTARQQEGLLLDSEGWVVEGSFSNLFLVKDHCLLTPLLDRCGVAGIAREVIIEQALAAGIAVLQQRVSLAEVMEADALFMTNSLIEAWPVRQFNGRQFDSVAWAARARQWLLMAGEAA